jgi:hypothetical protein
MQGSEKIQDAQSCADARSGFFSLTQQMAIFQRPAKSVHKSILARREVILPGEV